MTRLGTVLVFKEGATRTEVVKALESIRRLLDVPKVHGQWAGKRSGMVHSMHDEVHEFDDEYGGPVWYLP